MKPVCNGSVNTDLLLTVDFDRLLKAFAKTDASSEGSATTQTLDYCFVRKDVYQEEFNAQKAAGKTDAEIIATRERAIKALQERGCEIVNTLFTDEWYSKESMEKRGVVQIPLCFLAKSLENMSICHVAYFCKGWENARGCRIEHEAAKAYGLEIIYEDTEE